MSTEGKHLLSFSVKERKTRARESCKDKGEVLRRPGVRPCRAARASLVLSQLELEGLDVEAITEFVPGQEGS